MNILNAIVSNTKDKLEKKKSNQTLEELCLKLKGLNFKKSIFKDSLEGKDQAIIAEIKKASPSAGVISEDFDPILKAKEYESIGASALSILTEEDYFQGSIQYLIDVKAKTYLPILRKDFIIDEYQIYESKVYQADVILLIVSILNDDELKRFLTIANELNLDCIIETHDQSEIKRALKLDYPILGINNRNLKNLKTDLNNSLSLFTSISKDYTVIAESGIKTSDDISMYNDLGIFNFLIGESILRSKDYTTFIKKLLNHG